MFRRNVPQNNPYGRRRGGRSFKSMLVVFVLMGGFYLFKYFSTSQVNEITGETQFVSLTPDQEVAIGLQSAPSMIQQHGGLHPDQEAQIFVDQIGERLVNNTIVRQSGYRYDFHLLADPNVVNAFALPGGQVFITAALFSRLENEHQLAGILGHEIGHVIHRHGAERIAKMELTKGLTGAAVIASGDYGTAQAAQMIGNLINMKYGRDQELESDDWGIRLMLESGFEPLEMIKVMDILEQSSGGNRKPEFQSSHPSPENRREKIREAVERYRRQMN
ncbi:MAG: M48 family metalloprotease [Saprospiraceae bacterium]|nr:M48 family metalloprotease [Bacteroidia bacterium]NNE15413.1 M48 family metalloprotease [Saprospiraceae bacterium]NNL92269.1 M48 family metalloprotease [Saprospiraceae bacterium]